MFFLHYVGVAVLFTTRQPPRLKGYVDGTLVFGVPVAAFALQTALVHELEFGLAFSALAVGAVYLTLATLLWRRGTGMRLLTESFLALGVAFATLAVPLALDGRWTAVTWALECAALLWVGVRQQRLLPRATGVLLQLAAGVVFLAAFAEPTTILPVLNGAWLGAVLIAAAALFSACYIDRHRTRLLTDEHLVAPLLLAWGLLWWTGAGLHEIGRLLRAPHELLTGVAFFALSALVLDRAGAWLPWRTGSRVAMGLLPVLGVLAIALAVSDARLQLLSA